MPKYSYRCASCEALFEREMAITEKKSARMRCPECGSGDVAQSFAGVSVYVGKAAPERVTCCDAGQPCPSCDAGQSCPGCAMSDY